MCRKIIFAILTVATLSTCRPAKEAIHEAVSIPAAGYLLPDSVPVSASFRMFWEAWNEELKTAESLEQYTPSELLVKRFALQRQNGAYMLSGYLHTDTQFNEKDLIHLSGNCVTYSDTLRSFMIPLRQLPQFVVLPGIKYIESATVARLRLR